MRERKEGWCWARSKDCEAWHGMFASREEALAGAIAAPTDPDEGDGSLWVASYRYPEPEDYVCSGGEVDDLLEGMEERANDDGCYGGEDPLFECDRAAAGAALEALLKDWARKYIMGTAYSVDIDKAERVR